MVLYVVFESGFFSNHKAWKAAPFQRDVPIWLARHVIPAWGASLECKLFSNTWLSNALQKSLCRYLGWTVSSTAQRTLVMPEDMLPLANLESEKSHFGKNKEKG